MEVLKESFYKVGFWFLVIYLAGMISGIFVAKSVVIEKGLRDSVRLGAIVIGSKVFDLKERL